MTVRSAPARRRTGFVALLVGLLLALVVGTAGPAAAAPPAPGPAQEIACSSLPGSGSYSDPIRIGRVTGPVAVIGCPVLTSGHPFNRLYFSFSMAQPSAGSFVMTAYRIGAAGESGVHPRMAFGPHTVKHSLDAVHGQGEGLEYFTHSMADLWAGEFRVGAEKLSSPLSSVQTAPWALVVHP